MSRRLSPILALLAFALGGCGTGLRLDADRLGPVATAACDGVFGRVAASDAAATARGYAAVALALDRLRPYGPRATDARQVVVAFRDVSRLLRRVGAPRASQVQRKRSAQLAELKLRLVAPQLQSLRITRCSRVGGVADRAIGAVYAGDVGRFFQRYRRRVGAARPALRSGDVGLLIVETSRGWELFAALGDAWERLEAPRSLAAAHDAVARQLLMLSHSLLEAGDQLETFHALAPARGWLRRHRRAERRLDRARTTLLRAMRSRGQPARTPRAPSSGSAQPS